MNRENVLQRTEQQARIMLAFAVDGKGIQYRSRTGRPNWIDLGSNVYPEWNWVDFEYRIAPSTRVTMQELDYYAFNYVRVKHKIDGRLTVLNSEFISEPDEWYYLNQNTMTWEDRSLK